MTTPALRRLILDQQIGVRALRVYVYLSESLDFVRYRAVKLLPVATALGIKRNKVTEALRLLVDSGYLDKNGRAWPGGPYTYRLIYSIDEGPSGGTDQAA